VSKAPQQREQATTEGALGRTKGKRGLMPKKPTERPLQEHHAILGRVFRQVTVAKGLTTVSRKKLLEALKTAMAVLEEEMGLG
jgi:hypothetical protein